MGKKGWFGTGFASGFLAAWLIFSPGGPTAPDHIENLAAASPSVQEMASSHYREGNIKAPDPYLTVNYIAKNV